MENLIKQISDTGIIPVVKIDDAKDAVALATALRNGGINCAEITFRTAAAEEAIKKISEKYPDMLIAAGTVLTLEQADKAMNAGAKFIVSPGLNPTVVKHCLDKGYPIIPGTSNPSDVELALSFGLNVVKFFPAEAAGGIKMIKAMSAPYGNIKFMPTGGINADNLNDYLSFDKIIACGGSWMVPSDKIADGKFDEIEKLTAEAVTKMLGFSLIHIGVNSANEEEAKKTATMFEALFGLTLKDGNKSIFAGKQIEVMKSSPYGTKGHIAIGTNSVDRAVAYLKNKGVEFLDDTTTYDDKGKMKFIYLKDEFGGFAIHLIRS